MISEAIIKKFGFKEGLCTKEGKITKWPYDEKKPTIAELKVIVSEYKDSIAHVEPRKKAYPSIEDQLDILFKDKRDGTNKWFETIDKVKKDFPKQ
jgi:hypothetical protein